MGFGNLNFRLIILRRPYELGSGGGLGLWWPVVRGAMAMEGGSGRIFQAPAPAPTHPFVSGLSFERMELKPLMFSDGPLGFSGAGRRSTTASDD